MDNQNGKFKVEVIADSSGEWCSNQLRFETSGEATEYGQDLAWRWTSVRKWRVVNTETGEPVTDEVLA